jgi:fermentation-respiration switch protein FrsA (DUF1100 family)
MFWTILILAVGLYAGLTALMFFFQNRLVYFPLGRLALTPAARGLAYEDVWLETSDGVKLFGWFIPAEPARGVLLFFHGNAGNISHRLESIEQFHRVGLSVFIIDYRGYGRSEGRPSEQGTYLDAEAAWRYLVEARQVAPEKIVFFGRSLGGAVATRLAQDHPPAALIIESTFTSIPDMAAQIYFFLPVRLLARIDYNTLARLPELTTPILIIHSPDDEVIPYAHGQRLFAAAHEPKEFLSIRGGHNDGYIRSAELYEARLEAFLRRHLVET